MKRSSNYKPLVLLGGAATMMALAGCQQDDVSVTTYKDALECTVAGVLSATDCEKGFSAAQKEHSEQAPRYASQTLCEEDFGAGKCEQPVAANTGGGHSSYWGPYMNGYFMSRMLSGNGSNIGANNLVGSGRPFYTTKDNRQVNTGGSTFYSRSSNGQMTSRATFASKPVTKSAPAVRSVSTMSSTSKVSSGGFGSRSSSSFGG
jgi:uncharacterized protein YgiB involved in biofilm formation